MEELISTRLWKALRISVTLGTCMVLVSAFAAYGIATVQADPYDFSLWAVVTVDPYWGYYGGYHDVWYTIQPELVNIGIDFQISMFDQYTWYDIVWDSYWNSSSADAPPPNGWDMYINEWWLQPDAPSLWLEGLAYSWNVPPDGYNIMPWMNEKADDYLWKGLHTFDAADRKKYLWDWQEEFMHDPPSVVIYYPKLYQVFSVWFEGYDINAFTDWSHWAINETLFNQHAPDWRKEMPGTVLNGMGWEEIWNFNNLFTSTYNDVWVSWPKQQQLYKLTADPWPPLGQPAEIDDYCSMPDLAAAMPIYMDGPNGPDTRARILLREGVVWADGDDFNATDVKFTFDRILNPLTKAVSYGDVAPVIERVEIVNETCVDFILYAPSPDLPSLLTNNWGTGILPWHTLKDVEPNFLRGHPSNYDWQASIEYIPSIGPFELTNFVAGEYIELTRNPLYFGYDLGWGPHNIDRIICKWIPDPASRLAALKSHEIDFGDYTTGPVEDFEALREREDLTVWQYDYCVSNPIFLNLDSPYLSNRYVRQAIAHAVPYETVFNEIVPSWGVEAIPGKTYILPHHYYTDPVTNEKVHLYNDDLEPFEYNITKAQMYMDMWRYAQEGTDHTLGPVGDADFSGVVRLDDFILWATNFGTEPADWTFLPGNDIDPDFDNSGTVNLDDFIEWAANYGTYYPFEGAR